MKTRRCRQLLILRRRKVLTTTGMRNCPILDVVSVAEIRMSSKSINNSSDHVPSEPLPANKPARRPPDQGVLRVC